MAVGGCTAFGQETSNKRQDQHIPQAQLVAGVKRSQLTKLPPTYPHAEQTSQPVRQFPNTGATPGAIAGIGAFLLLFGIGLRLRSLDPSRF